MNRHCAYFTLNNTKGYRRYMHKLKISSQHYYLHVYRNVDAQCCKKCKRDCQVDFDMKDRTELIYAPMIYILKVYVSTQEVCW